jgi:F420-dependent oxidoreductase-like protein
VIELPSPCLVVLVGVAGSGKSTWADQHFPGSVVTSDALRALVGEGEDDLRASTDAFELVDDVIARRLRRHLTTVVDTLGSDAARRARWLQLAAEHGVECHAIVMRTAPADIRRWNKQRSKRVPDAILRSQLGERDSVTETVRGEPFTAVHEITPEVVPMLVAPTLATVTTRPAAPAAAETDRSIDEPRRGVTFGLQVSQFTWPGGVSAIGPHLRDIARRAEVAGFDALYVMDHFRQIPTLGPPWHDMLESWTTLSHVAAYTDRIRLGTMVTGVTHRSVPLLAKIVSTLDVLSGGRAICGVGAGWFEQEHHAYGWRFPPLAERYALLEDALALLPKMWGPGAKPFDGKILHVPDTSCYPRPLQARIPILVGGSGERRTLRLVAASADACNLFGDPAVVRHKVDVLRRHCDQLGRDPAEVSVSHLSTVLVGDDAAHVRALVEATRPPKLSAERHSRAVNAGTVEQHAARIDRYVESGVDHVVVGLADLADAVAVDRYSAVIAAARSRT